MPEPPEKTLREKVAELIDDVEKAHTLERLQAIQAIMSMLQDLASKPD